MSIEPGHIITLGLAAVALVVWLVRLEGRVNSADKAITAAERKASEESKAHTETKEALIRVEEQIKHLTSLVERLIPRRRNGSDA